MTYDKNHALLETRIPGLPAPKSGKVRDVFDLGDTLLMVVTDRISAFDVILPCGVPDKGKVLNQLSLFWLDFLGVKNHLVTADVDAYPAALQAVKEDLRGRSMLVKKVNMVEVECIARGYLTGSGWKEYQKSGTVNGQKLREGYQNASKLDEVLFTPTTKAAIGDHDEAIDYAQTEALVGAETAKLLKDATIGLYSKAADYALGHGTRHHHRGHEVRVRQGRGRLADPRGRGAHARQLALLAAGLLRGGREPAVARQAVCARLARFHPLQPPAPGAGAAGRRGRAHARDLRQGLRGAEWQETGLRTPVRCWTPIRGKTRRTRRAPRARRSS